MDTICPHCDKRIDNYDDFAGIWEDWDMSPGTETHRPEPPQLVTVHLSCLDAYQGDEEE